MENAKAKTIPQFCANNSISQSYYFELKKRGKAPREMAVGRRRLISPEAEFAWRREREDDAAKDDE